MEVIVVGGIIALIIITAFIAGLVGVECVKQGVVAACNDLGLSPTYDAPQGGSFFDAVGAVVSYLVSMIGWLFSVFTVSLGINGYIVGILSAILLVVAGYLILKLLSIGGG